MVILPEIALISSSEAGFQRAGTPPEKHKHAGTSEPGVSTSHKKDIHISEREFLHTDVWYPVYGAKRRMAIGGQGIFEHVVLEKVIGEYEGGMPPHTGAGKGVVFRTF